MNKKVRIAKNNKRKERKNKIKEQINIKIIKKIEIKKKNWENKIESKR